MKCKMAGMLEACAVVILIALLATNTLGQTEWTKYEGNPVLDVGAPGEWDESLVQPASVVFEDGIYKMWYTGLDGFKARIGYATSSDGVVWTKYAGNPVLDVGASGEWDDYWAFSPSILFEDGTYKMWYSGNDGACHERIGYATSTDGIHWTKYEGNPVLDLGASGEWDDQYVYAPSVIFEDGIYKMWYTGVDNLFGGGGQCRIGYATSTDGIHWTKYEGNPVLNLGAFGEWDDNHATNPFVLSVDGVYKMWYAGHSSSVSYPHHFRIGYAESSDGIVWTKYVDNPVLDVGAPGEWDDDFVYSPTVLFEDGVYKMWYRGNDGSKDRIGYAISYPPMIVVAIDIKPGSWPNAVNPDSKGVIPVAILTTSTAAGESVDFDATTVDSLSVNFGPGEAAEVHGKGHIEDVDDDGDLDMILHFKTEEIGIQAGDTEACLTGQTVDGKSIEGCDAIVIVPTKGKPAPVLLAFSVGQNFPNPSNPETWIPYVLAEASEVTIGIYDVKGRLVCLLDLGMKSRGSYLTKERAAYWNERSQDGEHVASGVYFYVMRAGKFTATRKMVIAR